MKAIKRLASSEEDVEYCQGVVAINDPKWPNALLVDERNLGDIINSLNSHKEAINTDWGYEYVKHHCKSIISKDDEGSQPKLQMMPYNDLLITENDDRNKAYSCSLECSLGFIDYSKQPDDNFKYVFVYQDDVTKFTILKPIKEKEREEISRCLLEIFSLFGVPAKIHTREKLLIKSVFNKDIGNFCQNFSTKIKQSKIGTFEDKECRKIDEDIKEWMKSAMSTKWSQGLCLVQFRNNCHYNEAINAAPFYALLKPSYTYSRRKYTRYMYRKKDNDEIPCPIFLKNPIGNSNREIEGTSKLLETCCRQDMEDKFYQSLKKQDNKTKNSDGQSEMVELKFLDNQYERDMRGYGRDRAKVVTENRRQWETLKQNRSCDKEHEEKCGDNNINKYDMGQHIHGILKNECNEVTGCKMNSENRRYNLNNISDKALSKEEKHVNLLKRIPQSSVLKNELSTKMETGNFNQNKSNQESSLIAYLDNQCGSVNLHEEPTQCCKKRKLDTGKESSYVPESAIHQVLSFVHDEKNIVAASQGTKHKQGENSCQMGRDLNKKVNVHGYEENKIPCVNSSNVGGFEILGNNQPNLDKKQLTSQGNNTKANPVRHAHDCRGKEVCSKCKKKKKQKAGLNSLNKTSLAIGSTVKVRVPVTERLKGYPNYILGTIVEEKDRMYKVATPKGVLKEMFKRDQLCPCNTPVDNVGSTNRKTAESSRALKSKVKHPFR